MTVNDFFNYENISKENPFEGIEIKKEVSMNEYKLMSKIFLMFTYTSDDEYLPLSKEFAIRFAEMIVMLNLEFDEESVNADDLFKIIMCSDIYKKFMTTLSDTQWDMVISLRDGLYELGNYKNSVIEQSYNPITKTLNAIGKLISNEDLVNNFLDVLKLESENAEV